MITLTWTKEPKALLSPFILSAVGYNAERLECGSAFYNSQNKTGVAMAVIGGKFLHYRCKTTQCAINALQREIDKRSIGLFGVDVVAFETIK